MTSAENIKLNYRNMNCYISLSGGGVRGGGLGIKFIINLDIGIGTSWFVSVSGSQSRSALCNESVD